MAHDGFLGMHRGLGAVWRYDPATAGDDDSGSGGGVKKARRHRRTSSRNLSIR